MILLIGMMLFTGMFFWCLLRISKDSDERIEEILKNKKDNEENWDKL